MQSRRTASRRLSRRPLARLLLETLESRLLLSAPATLVPSGLGGGGWFGPTSVNPYNHNEIWMPTDMGELFHSTDDGATWTYSNTITVGYHSPIQFTSNSNVMWDIDVNTDFVSKSTDGGNTWADASSWSYSLGQANFLYTDPTLGSNFIVAATSDGRVYLSTNGGTSWGSPIYTGAAGSGLELVVSNLFKNGNNVWIPTSMGILHSSNNGGSFSMLTVPWNYSTEAASSVAISQSGNTIRFVATTVAPSALYAGNIFEWSGSAKNVYLSDFNISTNTQGAWTNISSRLPANELEGFAAMAQGNINTIYLAGMNGINPNDYGPPSVLKSTDGGVTWTETFQYVNNANVATDQYGYWGDDYDYGWSGYAMSLQVCSNNANLITIADEGTAWMSTDGGTGGLNTTALNADWRDITVAPQYLHTPGTVLTAGTTAYAGSADNTAVYNVIFLSPTNLFAAMTDQTGMYSTDGGATWYYPTFNTGAFFSNFFAVTEDTSTGVLFASAGKQNDLFKNWRLSNGNRDERGGGLDYSTDGGKTWSLLKQWTNPDGSFNPLTDVVLDPSHPGRAYALVANSTDGGIWVNNNLYLADGKTVNTSATWTQLAVPTRTFASSFTYGWYSQNYAAGTYSAHDPNDLVILGDSTLVADFDETYDPTDSYMYPVSGIWVSTNGGATWTDKSDLNRTQSNMIFFSQKIVIDPADPTQNTWYVATDYNSPDYRANNYGVFETTNRGTTWTQIFTASTPDGEGYGADNITINPDTGEMYISSSSGGVYYSATRSNFVNLTQEPYGGVDNVIIDPYRSSEIFIATHGNGMREGDADPFTPSNLTAVGNAGHQITLNWSAVAGATSYLVQYTNGIVNPDGVVSWITTSTLPAGSTTANIDGLAANSSFYFRIVPQSGASILGYSNLVVATVLASPTTLAASSDSPHEVDLTWLYTGTVQGAQFQIQRSTDSSTWTTIATTTNTSITAYADTTAAANTFYYYRILTAFGASFLSAPSPFTSAKTTAAGLIAYDGFDYAPGAPLNGDGSAGDNWAGVWTVTGDNPSNTLDNSASLTPPANLATSNNGSISLGETGGTAQRTLSSSLSSYGSTLWVSALIKTDTSHVSTYGSLTIGNVIAYYRDATGSGNFQWTMLSANDTWYGASWSSGPAVANNTTYFVVMQITYNNGNDSVRIWLNPAPGSTAPANSASFDFKSGINAGGNLNNIQFAGSYYANTSLDELRLGATYASVAPLALPTAPATLAAATVSGAQVNLNWSNTSTNSSSYNIYASTDGLTFSYIGSSATNAYSATGLTAGTLYYFQVTAANSTGAESGYSNRAAAVARIPGDINNDGHVDLTDLTLLAANWQQPVTPWTGGDLNGNGFVDLTDLTLLASNWQAGTGNAATQDSPASATQNSALATQNSPLPTTSQLPIDQMTQLPIPPAPPTKYSPTIPSFKMDSSFVLSHSSFLPIPSTTHTPPKPPTPSLILLDPST